MKVDGAWRRAIERTRDGDIVVLDQTALPHRVCWARLDSLDDAARAIRDMVVRGAPLIGATAAYGVALALRAGVPLDDACTTLAATRPTAVNLRWALGAMRAVAAHPATDRAYAAFALATRIADDEVARCEAIGRHGLAIIEALARRRTPVRLLTHCNAGWLATVDWGTALAPIYRAHEAGIPVEVWVDETRPRNQGLLTAWELAQHGVPHTVIADNAGGHLMQRGQVDACIVGTDRTTADGDVCNKIGTYLKALAAHDTGVPFYVAAPSPSIDWSIARGADIPIEERSADEVRCIAGISIEARAAAEVRRLTALADIGDHTDLADASIEHRAAAEVRRLTALADVSIEDRTAAEVRRPTALADIGSIDSRTGPGDDRTAAHREHAGSGHIGPHRGPTAIDRTGAHREPAVPATTQVTCIAIVPDATPVANPAFDVTPARLVTALLTERGLCPASRDGLRSLFPDQAPPEPR